MKKIINRKTGLKGPGDTNARSVHPLPGHAAALGALPPLEKLLHTSKT